MGDKKFEIRFDKHGHIVVEDAELLRRLTYLMDTNGKFVLRMKAPEPNPAQPRLLKCPAPVGPIPRLAICPNAMCSCEIKVINEVVFDQQWKALGHDRDVR